MLVAAAAVALLLGERVDAVAIVAIVVLNAAIGFVQEYRAERAVAALARLTAPRARVVRGGRTCVVPAEAVVPGDVLALEAGDLVAADARVIAAERLRASEASLTGESEPVDKTADACAPATALGDRRGMVFLGTGVTSGRGRAVVVATGMATELGRIATLLETAVPGGTPLQRDLDAVGRRLLHVSLAIVLVVAGLGLVRGRPPVELFMGAVGLAVAAIPEGLPAIVTIALALGVQRMARRRALVRRLPAVETLGCAAVVCTDKTGTLTVGEMTARRIVTAERVYVVTGEGYGVEGGISGDDAGTAPTGADAPLHALLIAAVACNDAELVLRDGRPAVLGDPTEGALLVAAAKAGIHREAVEAAMPRLRSVPFDAARRRMTVVRRRAGTPCAFVKGAPEEIVARATGVRTAAGVAPVGEAERARFLEAAVVLAADALRVLALAERPEAPADGDLECGLTLLGLVGLQDPPRAESRSAVARCRRAGIRVVMITGDHPDTARAIARELGLLEDGGRVLSGADLDRLDDVALADAVPGVAVYARVSAEHKLRVVRAWKARGAVVAMTGDGVNDAPALKEASIGVAMGIAGTEVTKEAADLVVTDDDFSTVVDAVEEGRGIYDNIGRTLGYLVAGNAGELTVMLVAGLAGLPLPLLPVHLLWVNLVTDGLPALVLATDAADPGVLDRPPRRPEATLVDRSFLARAALIGTMTATVTLVAFVAVLARGGSETQARTAAFCVLVFEELLRAFGARSTDRPLWRLGLLSNVRLLVVVAGSVALQGALVGVPALRVVFATAPVAPAELATWLALGAVPLAALELSKVLRERRPAAAGRTLTAGDAAG